MTTKPTTKKASTTTATAKRTTKKVVKQVTENEIRAKAQEIYNKRMLKGVPGNAETDWLKAEKELLK